MNDNTSQALAVLFKPADIVGFKDDVTSPVRVHSTDRTQFFICNPIRNPYAPQAASLNNIVSYRNIVVEFDDGTLGAQRKLVDKSGLPYATCTFSGNKSAHFIVSVSEGFSSLDQYNFYGRAIYAVLGGAPDPKCKNANRLTRLPGSIRHDNGQLQELLEVRKQTTLMDLCDWLANGEYARNRFFKFQKQEADTKLQQELRQRMVTINGPTPLPRIYVDMLEEGINHPDAVSRHDGLVKFCAWLVHNGYNEEQLSAYITSAADAIGIGDRPDAEQLIAYFGRSCGG